MVLSQERKGEIALLVLKYRAQVRGVSISNSLPRELGNISKATGITIEELKELSREVIQEMVEKHLM